MPTFTSRIITGSSVFADNRRDMLELVGQFRSLEERAVAASNARLETFARRGQIAPHERIDACNWLLNSGRLNQDGRATVHYLRGLAFTSQGYYDKAIKDLR